MLQPEEIQAELFRVQVIINIFIVHSNTKANIKFPQNNEKSPIKDIYSYQNADVLDPAKEDGFYLLKKDSQRRSTLVRIMKDDKHNICATWHSLLLKVCNMNIIAMC